MAKRFIASAHVKNLPDVYRKTPDSNNAKILEMERRTVMGLRGELEEIYGSLDLEQAYGNTLDRYGEMVGQPRGMDTDEEYRTAILTRIMLNAMDGDMNSILHAMSVIFRTEQTSFQVEESEEPLRVERVGIPMTAIDRAGIEVGSVLNIVKSLLPVCVSLGGLRLEMPPESCSYAYAGAASIGALIRQEVNVRHTGEIMWPHGYLTGYAGAGGLGVSIRQSTSVRPSGEIAWPHGTARAPAGAVNTETYIKLEARIKKWFGMTAM